MARIIFVKKAQQRYATVPVIDPATGEPKIAVVINKRTGEQKVTKRGKPVTMRVTESDKSRPLPPATCDHCRKPIEVGTPYKHVTIKSGPYGGQRKNRHASCPTWRPSQLSTSKMAGIYAAQESFSDFMDGTWTTADEVTDALNSAAEEIRAVAEEYRESAENIREGFGHDTYQSEEIDQKAEDLDAWADDVESADVPEPDEEVDCSECSSGEIDCDQCNGMGLIQLDESDPEFDPDSDEEQTADCNECSASGSVDCQECGGTGQVAFEDDEDAMDEWRDSVRDAVAVIDECPV